MTLEELNTISQPRLKEALMKCCGSTSWVKMMMAYFPTDNMEDLLEEAEDIWQDCSEDDWKEAFAHHPQIGDVESLTKKVESTADPIAIGWATGEQSGVNIASKATIEALAEGNRLYEEKFGYIFIVCATGKSAKEMLTILETRLKNKAEEEIKISAGEQNKITKLRLQKLLE